MNALFKKLILLGCPASGKSEFIDFLKKIPEAKRSNLFHIGKISELDDFVWLWQKFVEDDLWEKAGHRRLYSTREGDGYLVSDSTLLDFCLEKFNTEIKKVSTEGTLFIEFARGSVDGGFRYALNRLSDEVLNDAAIFFIYTSYAEACRRNEARYQEKLKHSILAHKVPEKDMIRFGKEIDWLELTQEKPSGHLNIRNHAIPFVTMDNEIELKEEGPLSQRYKEALSQLMNLYQKKSEAMCA